MTVDPVKVAEATAAALGRRWRMDPGDLLGACWQGAVRGLRAADPGRDPAGIMRRTAWLAAIDYARRGGGHFGAARRRGRGVVRVVLIDLPPGADDWHGYGPLEPAAPDPDDGPDREHLRAAVAAAVAALPRRERLVVDACFGLTGVVPAEQREAAAVVGLSPAWVSKVMPTVLDKLRSALGGVA